MNRVLAFTLPILVLCAILTIIPYTFNTTYLASEVTSAFASAIDLSRDLTAEQLYSLHHAAKTLITPYISVTRHIVTNAIEDYPLLRLAEEYLVPQPSYENLTFHAERGACVWTYSSTGLPADFSPHTGTLFLLLATNVCTAILCLSIGAAIFAPLRLVRKGINALANLVAKPEATWETVIEDLASPLAMLAAAGVHCIIFCATATLFCVGNIIMYAAELDIGVMKRPAPLVEEPKVFYRTVAAPRVSVLEAENRKLQLEVDAKAKLCEITRQRDAKTISGLLAENSRVEDANKAQKLVIKGHMMMHAKIDLTRPMYEQYKEKEQRYHDAKQDFNRVTEEKIELQSDFWKQLDERVQEIADLKMNQRSLREQNSALLKSLDYHQDRANRGDEVSRAQIECQKKRIKHLEGLQASKNEELEARVKELLDLVATHTATIESLEAQLKERDELMQALEARIKEQEARHSSEQKSQETHLMESFESERSKLVELSKASSEARKSAEEAAKAANDARKVADEAREAAEQSRKAAEEGRKKAEDDSAANLAARKAAEEARKTAVQDAALQKFRAANRPYSQNKGTQTSTSPPGSPSTTTAGSGKATPPPPTSAPPPPSGKTPLPPPGQRPILKAKSVAPKLKLNLSGNSSSYKSTIFPQLNDFSFDLSGGANPNVSGTSPAAASSEPKGPPLAPSTLEPSNPPAGASAPKPNTPPAAPSAPEPTNPPAGSTTGERTNLPPLPSTPELKTSPAPSTPEPNFSPLPPTPEPKTPSAPSNPEPANLSPLFSSPESKGSPAPSKPEPVQEPAQAEGSPAKPASKSGEQSKAPEPTAP